MAAPALTAAFEVENGSPHPLGATTQANGVNFSLFSGGATGVELLLFDKHDSLQPLQTIPLLPSKNKTFHFWHIFVKNLQSRCALRISCDRSVGPRGGLAI
jgi:isoamylase